MGPKGIAQHRVCLELQTQPVVDKSADPQIAVGQDIAGFAGDRQRFFQRGAECFRDRLADEVDDAADVVGPIAHRHPAPRHIDALHRLHGQRKQRESGLPVGSESNGDAVDQDQGALAAPGIQAAYTDIRQNAGPALILYAHTRDQPQGIFDVAHAGLVKLALGDCRPGARIGFDRIFHGRSQPIAREGTVDRGAEGLRPAAVSGAVVQDQVVVDQIAGDAEGSAATHESEGAAGEGTIGHADVFTSESIIDHFVPDQNPLRIGLDLVRQHYPENHVLGGQELIRLFGGEEPRLVDGRNAVLAGPAGDGLLGIVFEREAQRYRKRPHRKAQRAGGCGRTLGGRRRRQIYPTFEKLVDPQSR